MSDYNDLLNSLKAAAGSAANIARDIAGTAGDKARDLAGLDRVVTGRKNQEERYV